MALEATPEADRSGPRVLNEATGLPDMRDQFGRCWRAVRTAANLPANLWSRDLRASVITEARGGGATNGDAVKVVGHTKRTTADEVYDRERLKAHRRFATARLSRRARASERAPNVLRNDAGTS